MGSRGRRRPWKGSQSRHLSIPGVVTVVVVVVVVTRTDRGSCHGRRLCVCVGSCTLTQGVEVKDGGLRYREGYQGTYTSYASMQR